MAKRLKQESKIHALIKKYFMFIVVFAIILIPSIYTVLFLGSMWDPYGNTGNLPVAIVNEDEAVLYNGNELNIGKQLCDNLKKNKSLQFNFVDEQVALDGLENGTYYMVMVVPKDFSANSTTLTSDNPQKMEIEYYVNPGTNYIASKFGESAVKTIKETLNKTVINTYATTVYAKLDTIGAGFTEAADGSGQLYDGVGTLRNGNGQLTDGLGTLSNGCLTLKEGTGTLEDGLKTYTNGVSQVDDGMAQLVGGSQQLSDGVGQLDGGVTQIKSGTSELVSNNDALNDGAAQLLAGLNTMSEQVGSSLTEENLKDLQTLEAGLLEINDGIQTLQKAINEDYKIDQEKIDKVQNAIKEVDAIVQTEEYAKLCAIINEKVVDWDNVTNLLNLVEHLPQAKEYKETIENLKKVAADMKKIQGIGAEITPEKSKELVTKANSLIDAYGQLTDGVQRLSDGGKLALPTASDTLKKMTNGLLAVQDGLDRTMAKDGETGLIEGMTTLKNGIATYTNGVSQVDGGVSQVSDGIKTLSAGVGTAGDGINRLYAGTQQLVANNAKLNSGASQLNGGAGQLYDGSLQLYDGTLKIDDGCEQLMVGANRLRAALSDGANQIEETNTGEDAAEMFSQPVDAKEIFQRHINSNGEAMSAYMMCAALWVGCLAFCLMFSPFNTSLKNRKTFIRHAIIALFVAVVQAVLMVTLIMAIDGMRPAHTVETYLMAVFASVAFMSLVYMLNTMFDSIGSFMLLVLLCLQLSGAAGTYPIELSPKFYQIIHPLMPFTYGVDAFRSTISTSNPLTTDIAVFCGIILVCGSLTILTYILRKKKLARQKENQITAVA